MKIKKASLLTGPRAGKLCSSRSWISTSATFLLASSSLDKCCCWLVGSPEPVNFLRDGEARYKNQKKDSVLAQKAAGPSGSEQTAAWTVLDQGIHLAGRGVNALT